MLLISEPQMRALHALAFPRWLENHLTEHFPEAARTMAPGGLVGLIDSGTAAARSLGFTEPVEVCQYLDILMALYPDPDTDTWAARQLNGLQGRSPQERMAHLLNVSSERLANTAHG